MLTFSCVYSLCTEGFGRAKIADAGAIQRFCNVVLVLHLVAYHEYLQGCIFDARPLHSMQRMCWSEGISNMAVHLPAWICQEATTAALAMQAA